MPDKPAEVKNEVAGCMTTISNDAANHYSDASCWESEQFDSEVYVIRTASIEISIPDVFKKISKMFRHKTLDAKAVIIGRSVRNYAFCTNFIPNFHSLSELERFNI